MISWMIFIKWDCLIKNSKRIFRHVIVFILIASSFVFAANRETVDMALQHYQRGAYEKALAIFRDVYNSKPVNENVFAAVSLFMMVKCDFELSNYDQVIHDSRLFERTFIESRYLPDVMFERAKALAIKNQHYPAMLSAIRILSLTQEAELRKDVMEFSSDISRFYLQPKDLEMLSSLVVGVESLTYLKLIWAEKNIMSGDIAGAENLLQEVKSDLVDMSFIEKYKELNKYLNKSRENIDPEINIAVVLPLTGRYSTSGNDLLEGIKFAFESYRNKCKKRVNIIIVDTESDIRSGLSNLKELLDMQNITAVIGPLTSEMAISMAPLCEYAGVPLIAPTATADNLIEMGNSIFQLNPEQQQRAKVLANFATDSLKFKRFAVVAPTTEYGIDITNAFTKTVESNGAKVVYNVWYNDVPTNINSKLEELKDNAEYLPPYFNYLKGYYEAKASGYFEMDTATVEPDSMEIAIYDSIFVDSLAFDSLFVDSLYIISSLQDTTPVIDTIFILEDLWPDDPSVYEVLLFGSGYNDLDLSQDTVFAKLKSHVKNWLSEEITLEEKYNAVITDSICIFLDEQVDPLKLEISCLLAELDTIRVDSNYIGDYYFSYLIEDTVALEPYINFELIDSLKITLAEIDSIQALWVLYETDTALFPFIFPFENYGIDAVYFPIPQNHIQYIAPQWAKYRFKAFLLGDGNWYSESLLNRYKSNIDSMLIASDYYWDSKDIELRRFSKYFTQKTDKQPGRINVYGYETMNLLMKIIESGGNTSLEISEKLKAYREETGLIRKIKFESDRPRSNSGVKLITFYNGKLRPIK